MRAGDGAALAGTLLDRGGDALRESLFRDRAAVATERANPELRDLDLRVRDVANLPRDTAFGFSVLRKFLQAKMAGLRDGIDDVVRILDLPQRRPGMAGPTAGPAFRLLAQARDALLRLAVGRRFRQPAARRRLAAVAADRIRTAFEFSGPLPLGHGQFPQLPILLGQDGFLGLMRGEFGLLGRLRGDEFGNPAAGGAESLWRDKNARFQESKISNLESISTPNVDRRTKYYQIVANMQHILIASGERTASHCLKE